MEIDKAKFKRLKKKVLNRYPKEIQHKEHQMESFSYQMVLGMGYKKSI